ncbi:MAG: hypothetical protein KBS94_00260 [Prevotella sp.]|nr:hypothetical protein [Candidatus Equicola faecalis]
MKKECLKVYESPMVSIIDIRNEQRLCSTSFEVQTEVGTDTEQQEIGYEELTEDQNENWGF